MTHITVNTIHWINAGSMLRRRPNIDPPLVQCLVFAGMSLLPIQCVSTYFVLMAKYVPYIINIIKCVHKSAINGPALVECRASVPNFVMPSHQPRNVDPLLVQWWAIVCDAGPALAQYRPMCRADGIADNQINTRRSLSLEFQSSLMP